jgi:enoyl-CoA hydratase/carnithine racemase
MSATLRVDRANNTVTLSLTRPCCMDIAGKHELTHVLNELASDENIRALILTSGIPSKKRVDSISCA